MESPVIVPNCVHYTPPPKTEETGFPFDDTDYTGDRLQSTLDDIAQRHPEFAGHLNLDNFGSWRRKRTPSGSSTDRTDRDDPRFHTTGQSSRSFDTPDNSRRFADHSFPSGFNRFPFTHHFDDFTDDIRTDEKPPEVPRPHVNEKRGRKVQNPNLPQHLSNTVDLGQKQAPVEENRGQRSMSAPPENRTGHSSHSYDNNQPRNMGGAFSRGSRPNVQPSQTSGQQSAHTPKERIIPIHVEGRDEPVIPKNVNINPQPDVEPNHVNQQYHAQHMSGPQMHQNVSSEHHNVPSPGQHGPSPNVNTFTKQSTPPAQQKPMSRQVPIVTQEQPQTQQQEPPPVNLNDPLEKIKSVKADVLDLMQQVENFSGTRRDKHYVYLDEMLTRNLLKLDNIETEGKDNIRLARREAIKCIQETINNLEAKAQAFEKQQQTPTKSNSGTNVPEVESAEPKKYKSEVKVLMKTPSVGDDKEPPFESMQVDQQPEVANKEAVAESIELDNKAGKPENEASKPEASASNLAEEVKTPAVANLAGPTQTDAQLMSETSNPSQLADETK